MRAYLTTASLQYRHLRPQPWLFPGVGQSSSEVPLPSVAWSDTLEAKFGTMRREAPPYAPQARGGLLWDTRRRRASDPPDGQQEIGR